MEDAQAGGERRRLAPRAPDFFEALRRDLEVAARPTAALGSRLARPRSEEAARFEAIERGIDRTRRHGPARRREHFGPNLGAVGLPPRLSSARRSTCSNSPR